MAIYSLDVVSAILANLYDSEKQTIPEFIDSVRKDSGTDIPTIFADGFQYVYFRMYTYFMEHPHLSSDCTFVNYWHLLDMKRPDNAGEGLDSCEKMNQNTMYLSKVYPSTGTKDYVIAVAKRIDLDLKDDSKFDSIMVIAINLSKFSEDIKHLIGSEDVKLVLVDKEGQIVFDCDHKECLD